MKDLFETLVGFESEKSQRHSRRRSQKNSSLEGSVLRDLMGGSYNSDSFGDFESTLDNSTNSSILEDFDYDRDFEDPTIELGRPGSSVAHEIEIEETLLDE